MSHNQRPNIWKLQADKDVEGLIAALQHADPDIRKRSAAALRVLGSTKAVFALERSISRERDPIVRDHLRAALEHLNRDEIIDNLIQTRDVTGLVETLYSPHMDDVLRATQALGEIGDRLATEGLVMIFRSPTMSDDIRLAAAEALLKLESAPAVVTLLGALRKDSWRVRHNAAAVLGQLRATWATKPLIEVLQNEDNAVVRRTAGAALRRFNTPQSLQALETHKDRIRGQTGKLPVIPPPPDEMDEENEPATSTPSAEATPPTPPAVIEASATTPVTSATATPKADIPASESKADVPSPITEIEKRHPIVVLGQADDTTETLSKPPKGLREAIQAMIKSPVTPPPAAKPNTSLAPNPLTPPTPSSVTEALSTQETPPKSPTHIGDEEISSSDDTIIERPPSLSKLDTKPKNNNPNSTIPPQ